MKPVVSRIEKGFLAVMPESSNIHTFGIGETEASAVEDLRRCMRHERAALRLVKLIGGTST